MRSPQPACRRHVLGIGIETAMRRHAFAHLQTLCFDNHETGHLVARLTKDLVPARSPQTKTGAG